MNPTHPLYIVTKGRWKSRMTSKRLTQIGVPHFLVVEEQEREQYAAVAGPRATILVLDPEYKRAYETCDDLGLTKSPGPGPARNFAWDHSIASGATWHWVMDDNIMGFYRLNFNLKTPVADGTIFAVMEQFCERYTNVAMAGPNYFMFAPRKAQIPPFVPNTRIYSCNLIRNDVPYRWRGRYNEDTDLSLRMLKDGWCTVQFNAFLQDKLTTQHLAGGNTAEFYASEGTLPKSRMLEQMHPDVARVVWRFNRWHHYVDYTPFRHMRLQRRPELVIPSGVDNFGMVLEQYVGAKLYSGRGRWIPVAEPDHLPDLATTRQDIPADLLAEALSGQAPLSAPIADVIPEVLPWTELDSGQLTWLG